MSICSLLKLMGLRDIANMLRRYYTNQVVIT